MEDQHIHIGKDTLFEGIVHARTITVEGTVQGEVNATDEVFIRKDGVVNGPVRTQKILLEEGARHNGKIKLLTESSLPEEKKTISTSFSEENKQLVDKELKQPYKRAAREQ